MTRTAAMQNALPNARIRLATMLLAGLAAWLLAAAPAGAEAGYSYLRTVEGYANLESTDEGTLEAIENQPLIPGDSLVVGTSSRVEAVLADGAVLRVGGSSNLRFDALGSTPDTADVSTRLFLAEGELQIVLGLETEGEGPLEVMTGNATLYLEAPGEYTVDSAGYDRTSVVVRDGFAEAQTDRGSAILRSGEAGYIDGTEWASVEVALAGRRSDLEAWGEELDDEARLAEMPYVEPGLRYRAARMANHGAWIDIGGRWGWRPHVSAGWRPYVDGSWRYTPSGLTWVSNEPWGWIPSHYGSWDLVPGYGWTWFAGSYYSPASVYWYWGPTHVAWVPAGYYTSFYSPRHHVAPRFGVYGWAGGSWGFFAEWTFCPTRYFGRGRYNHYFRSGHDVGRHASYREIPRGVIATDTRSLRRDVWGQPERIANRLIAADSRLSAGSLPDVTDFVARRKEVRPEIADIVRPQDVATVRGRSRASATEVRERVRVTDTVRRGRPTVERRVAGEARRYDASRPGADRRPRSVDAPPTGIVDRGTRGRPTIERRDTSRPPVVRRGTPTSDRVRDERSRVRPGNGRSEVGADRLQSAPGDDRAVVRKVIEQMRSRQAPAPPRPTTRATPSSPRPPRASASESKRRSARAQGTSSRSSNRVRSSSSGSRPPRSRASSSGSRSSRARSSSDKPPPRKSSRSRSGSRKPPGGAG